MCGRFFFFFIENKKVVVHENIKYSIKIYRTD